MTFVSVRTIENEDDYRLKYGPFSSSKPQNKDRRTGNRLLSVHDQGISPLHSFDTRGGSGLGLSALLGQIL